MAMLEFSPIFDKEMVRKPKKFTAEIKGLDGDVVFRQEDVIAPCSWSQTAVNVVASKYFRGRVGDEDREFSVNSMVRRVTGTISDFGEENEYFDRENRVVFERNLYDILIDQYASFNSPVWFNVGVEEKPQCSACFINSVEDSMESILELVKTEGMLFKHGSGTGTNLSVLRSSKESVKGGGVASGPVSFMRGYDAFAGVIKSGGKTRRSAKMVLLDVDHLDIEEFIWCKAKEERKAKSLLGLGYSGGMDGEAYTSVSFQNGNNSVRVTNAFMEATQSGDVFVLRGRKQHGLAETRNARSLLRQMAGAAWECGDPGIQFADEINLWNTCASSGKINASNPCGEFVFLDDTACNLASLNLAKFVREDGEFDVDLFIQVVRVMITAMDILVDMSSYPTGKITENSHTYRPLGLGYANLHGYLMAKGIPYDSEEGREFAASVTALLTGAAYYTSSELALHKGSFDGFEKNKIHMFRILRGHKDATRELSNKGNKIATIALEYFHKAIQNAVIRNSQVTVLAPTGTIGFMMDCDTTGIEPELSLVKYKTLSGGGSMKVVNKTVGKMLSSLGYSEAEAYEILEYIEEHGHVEGCKAVKEKHLPSFDCAFVAGNGTRSISPEGHVLMMAAVQPFLSGAISKTVNMPKNATIEDIEKIYVLAWEKRLKSITVYRDGCKQGQPVKTSKEQATPKVLSEEVKPVRKRMPAERKAITHKFSIDNQDGYITVGMFDDGTPGEIFITMAKEGSVISGLLDCFATCVSMALQYGVPLPVMINKFSHTRFEPSGFTGNKSIPIAKSIIDYIFRWLAFKFLPIDEMEVVGVNVIDKVNSKSDTIIDTKFDIVSDAPPCHECGMIMVRNGSCYKCANCGSTSGCS